ncbi:MAG: lytic transglycosylase domain-containing protein [Firmicutes bacterium]|nr:lytic transglycosylase domain-containing protein [Bacillota bacterium]
MMRALTVTLCILVLASVTGMLVIFAAYPLGYRDEIKMASARFDIEPDLIASIIRAESSFNPDARNVSGASGLMQLMPATARWMGNKMGIDDAHEKLFEPEVNITIGTAYLKYLIDKFTDLRTALFAYNAGEGKVATWLKLDDFSEDNENGLRIITHSPYPSSNAYVDRVLGARWIYRLRF